MNKIHSLSKKIKDIFTNVFRSAQDFQAQISSCTYSLQSREGSCGSNISKEEPSLSWLNHFLQKNFAKFVTNLIHVLYCWKNMVAMVYFNIFTWHTIGCSNLFLILLVAVFLTDSVLFFDSCRHFPSID